jgi:putative ABC transport system substrate-binding protein
VLIGSFLMLIAAGGTLAAPEAGAQRKQPVRIGVLTDTWGPTPAVLGLRDGLQALGHREGEDFDIGIRFTQGDVKALPRAAQDLLAAGSDLIFATTMSAARAARQATSVKPIVFAEVVGDPVKLGLVQTFARPGGNVTGVSSMAVELTFKRLEIFKELVPALKRVALVYDPNDFEAVAAVQVHRDAARQLGLQLLEIAPRNPDEVRELVARFRRSDVDGVVMSPSGASLNIPGTVVELGTRHRIPTLAIGAYWTERGALVSYGPDFYDSGRQAARLVAKILRGDKPEDIPVETNSRIEFVINLKVARTLNLQPSPALLQRADRLID